MIMRINIFLFKEPFTKCFMSEDLLILSHQESYKLIGVGSEDSDFCINMNNEETNCKNKWKLKASALQLQPFIKECIYSEIFRVNLLKNLSRITGCSNEHTIYLKLLLEPPDRELIDYLWNEKMLCLIWTRLEIENAFSWLSTLGGAYSALGDYFEHCAEEAGRIAIRQYKLSLMLGDRGLAARSRLYSALAYSQKGNLKLARRIVRSTAEFARLSKDRRLNRMCQGVWAKLKYLRQIQKGSQSTRVSDCGDSQVVRVK